MLKTEISSKCELMKNFTQRDVIIIPHICLVKWLTILVFQGEREKERERERESRNWQQNLITLKKKRNENIELREGKTVKEKVFGR